jgi:hypothetical protein
VEKNFGSLDLFEGGAEARNESVGQVADEADGIGEQDLAAGRKLQLPEFGSSVANMRADSSTPASVRALKRVLLPALV